ncbi:MAG: hypothetical protein QW545_05375 [Thermosphaera sp.]
MERGGSHVSNIMIAEVMRAIEAAGRTYLYTLGSSVLKYLLDMTRQAWAGESMAPRKPPRKAIVK